MKKIWCIVGQENVWANIQPEEAPVQLNFDLEDSKLWKPFIDKKIRAEFLEGGAIQNRHCQTNAPDILFQRPRENLSQLEDQIKRYLTGKFEDERIAQVKKTTNWNIAVSDDLKKVL
jgi:hypothetical protein